MPRLVPVVVAEVGGDMVGNGKQVHRFLHGTALDNIIHVLHVELDPNVMVDIDTFHAGCVSLSFGHQKIEDGRY